MFPGMRSTDRQSFAREPRYRVLTVGPHLNESGVVIVGVAAHITAASAGGPRFDPSLTEGQRRSPQNGISLLPEVREVN